MLESPLLILSIAVPLNKCRESELMHRAKQLSHDISLVFFPYFIYYYYFLVTQLNHFKAKEGWIFIYLLNAYDRDMEY